MQISKDDVIKWMNEYDHSQRWLGTKLGVAKNTVQNWFSKNGNIPKMHLKTIAKLIKNNNIHKNHIVVEFDRDELCLIANKSYQENLSINEWIEISSIEHSKPKSQ